LSEFSDFKGKPAEGRQTHTPEKCYGHNYLLFTKPLRIL
jgi:hypothetical protein